MLGAGYLSQSGHAGYLGAGMDGTTEMQNLASSGIWGQDSYYGGLLDERASALTCRADKAREKPESKLLSPMYAPSMSLDGLPPFTLA